MKPLRFYSFLICVGFLLTESPAQSSTVPVSPQDKVEVTVLNENQEPVSGVSITLYGLRPANDTGSHYGIPQGDSAFVTNPEGKVLVEFPRYVYEEVETAQLTFRVQHPDYAETMVDHFLPDGSSNPIVLIRGGELLPQVNKTGESLETFKIYVDNKEHTIRSGHQTMKGIEPGDHTVYALYEEEGVRFFSEVKSVSIANHQQVSLDLDLYPGVTLKGQLESSVPRPIRNGKVQVNMINQPRSSSLSNLLRSPQSVHRTYDALIDEQGFFSISNLPKGYGEIIALCEGWITTEDLNLETYQRNQHFDLQQNGQEITVQMEQTATLKGQVINPQLKPVLNAKVRLWPNVYWGNGYSSVFMDLDFSSTTDTEGNFFIQNLPGRKDSTYTVESDEYELIPVQDNLLYKRVRRVRSVDLSPGETEDIKIEVVPKGSSQIQASR